APAAAAPAPEAAVTTPAPAPPEQAAPDPPTPPHPLPPRPPTLGVGRRPARRPAGDPSRKIAQAPNGRGGWLFNWHSPDEPILGHLTVKATGPGGTDEQTVGVYHPDTEQP